MVVVAGLAAAGMVAGLLKGISDARSAKKLLARVAKLTGQSTAMLLKGVSPFFTDEKGNSTLTKLLNANTNKTFALAQKGLDRQLVRSGLRDAGAGSFKNTGLELLRGEAFARNKQTGFNKNLEARNLMANNLMGQARLSAGLPSPSGLEPLLQGAAGLAGGLEAGSVINSQSPGGGGGGRAGVAQPTSSSGTLTGRTAGTEIEGIFSSSALPQKG